MATPALIQLISLLFLVGLSTAGRKESFSRIIKIEEFIECPKNGVNRIENITVDVIGRGKYLINLDFKVTKALTGGKLWITVYKCRLSSVIDCEYQMKYHLQYCNILNEPGPWTEFLKAAHPKFKCPMNPGIYMITNASLDASKMAKIGSVTPSSWWDNYHWRTKFELINKKQNLGCGIVTLTFQRIRSN